MVRLASKSCLGGSTYENGPKVDESEQCEIHFLVERKEVGEHVIGDRLEVAIDGVERMRCERSRD